MRPWSPWCGLAGNVHSQAPMKASRTSPTQCARCRQDPTIPKRWRCRGCGRRVCAHRIAFKVDGPAACFACLQEAQIDRRDPLAPELWTRSVLRDVPRPHGQVLHLATDDGKMACGWARRPFAQLTTDPRFVTCTLCRKRAVGGAARPVFSDDERRSLFLYCRNHTVATCCGRSLGLMDLAADFFPVRHEALCPECRGALIDEARAHL